MGVLLTGFPTKPKGPTTRPVIVGCWPACRRAGSKSVYNDTWEVDTPEKPRAPSRELVISGAFEET